MEAGIDETNALQLGRTYPAHRCRAAIAYVRSRRQGVKNPGGYIRFLLENDVSIPTQYFKRDLSGDLSHTTDPETDSASNVIPLSAAERCMKTSERCTTAPADSLYAFGPSTAVYPLDPPSAEYQMRERLKKGQAELRKLPKGRSLLSGLLDHLGVKGFEDVVNEDLPDVMGFFEEVYRSAVQ